MLSGIPIGLLHKIANNVYLYFRECIMIIKILVSGEKSKSIFMFFKSVILFLGSIVRVKGTLRPQGSSCSVAANVSGIEEKMSCFYVLQVQVPNF